MSDLERYIQKREKKSPNFRAGLEEERRNLRNWSVPDCSQFAVSDVAQRTCHSMAPNSSRSFDSLSSSR
jgi:hypothetical protein